MNTVANIATTNSTNTTTDFYSNIQDSSANGFAAILALQISDSGELIDTSTLNNMDKTEPTPATDPSSMVAALLQQITPANFTKPDDVPENTQLASATSPQLTTTTPGNIALTTTVAATIDDTTASATNPQTAFTELLQQSTSADTRALQQTEYQDTQTTGAFTPADTPIIANAQPALSAATTLPAGSSNTPAFVATVTTPIHLPEWRDHFAQQISWFSTQGKQVAELQLNPAELGPVSIKIEITDNQATASFSSPHSEVRTAIENALPKLRETLAENGINLGQTNVSDQSPKERQAERMSHATTREFATENATTINVVEPAPVRRQLGLLDTFA